MTTGYNIREGSVILAARFKTTPCAEKRCVNRVRMGDIFCPRCKEDLQNCVGGASIPPLEAAVTSRDARQPSTQHHRRARLEAATCGEHGFGTDHERWRQVDVIEGWLR